MGVCFGVGGGDGGGARRQISYGEIGFVGTVNGEGAALVYELV